MVFSDSSRVWPMNVHALMIRPSKPSPTQRPDMFRPCGYSTKYSVPLDFGGLRCSAHYRAMITTAWELGARHATGDPPFRQWAHRLGYGGHFPTKSRRYWPYAVRSISDWKNDYLDICHSCSVRNACGGVFTTSGNRLSQHLRPLP